MYFTVTIQQPVYQLTIDDLFNGVDDNMLSTPTKHSPETRTKYYNSTPQYLLKMVDINLIIEQIEMFNKRYQQLIDNQDKASLFYHFKIPKRSGGLRQIDAPNEQLMKALREFKELLEHSLFAKHHTSAFAYARGRSPKLALEKHQKNKSRWFLKLDFHDFFGSITPDFLKQQLKQIFPFNEIYKTQRGENALDSAFSLCFLNGKLPQGTPASPLLTNLIMIPVDFKICKMVNNNSPHLCYTRYSDDILISSEFDFKWQDVVTNIVALLNEEKAPIQLNAKKTRYASSSGRNWNLGLMLNKDNQITVGFRKKKILKATLHTFMSDFINGNYWSISDVQSLHGTLNHYRQVEKEAIDKIVSSYSAKFNLSVDECIKKLLKSSNGTTPF